ncbi:Scr1 family TA system antitoxin-like transcriptional regulator [Saccharopolyspora sp. NPDC050642]|uniref:Scr1 family TA system antitoxin-like transcriptional regulator n=1 Tax=Saccharopolyspora sp. NPDC050642 TaxID=3157099 RepID=UPI0033CCCF06
MPFDLGSYGAMPGGLTIIGHGDPDDPPAVYLEYAGGGSRVENVSDVKHFADMFAEIAGSALSAEKSAELIRAQARAWG